jgi:hypothetical protein
MADASDVWTDHGWVCGICEEPTRDQPCAQHQPNRHRKTNERSTR